MSEAKENVTPINPSEDSEQMVTMPVELLNKILGTLGSMPYVQVAGLMHEIQQGIQQVGVEADDL
jgi:hypothetical protein